jgi:hypothetical protein
MPYKKLDVLTYKLYSLSDSSGIRYIVITKQCLRSRLSGHIASCRQAFKSKKSRHHRHCWIKSLLDKDIKPVITLLAEYKTVEEVKQAEILAIKRYPNLVNATAGGDGIREYKHTEETMAKRRYKVDQYDQQGNFITTYDSLSLASLAVSGDSRNNSKISLATKGKRRIAYGYVWRIHTEPFNKYSVVNVYNWSPESRKILSNYRLTNNPMSGKSGLQVRQSRPVLIMNSDNVILDVTESVKEVYGVIKLSRSCIEKMLKLNKEVNNYKLAYATQEIVDNIKKDKEQTLNQIKGTIYLT